MVDFPWSCSFDASNWCGMTHTSHSSLKWEIHTGESDTPNTGPTAESLSQHGDYLLFDASQEVTSPDDVASLVSPTFPDFTLEGRSFQYCLQLNVFMRGKDVGTFAIKNYDDEVFSADVTV